jgi:cyclophilin family peptidyl-prolyl cis-trans isomerase
MDVTRASSSGLKRNQDQGWSCYNEGVNMDKLIIVLFIVMLFSLNAQTVVEWKTNMGDFKAELREDLVPITAYNFRDLTNDGFYDGCIFHRVIADFMIQDGDPTGTGYGGPGYTIPDEFHPELTHERGVISMANTGNPNSGGSQYFITVVPTHWLDNAHAVFGHIIEGMAVVDAISVVPTNASNHPLEDVVIDSIRVLTPPIDSFMPECTRDTVDIGHIEVFLMDTNDLSLEYEWYVNDELQAETSLLFTHYFLAEGYTEIKCIASGDYEYDYVLVWQYTVINNEEDQNEIPFNDQLTIYPNPFNPQTTIAYELAEAGNVSVDVYNVKGQKVAELVNRNQKAGQHNVVWKAAGQASGIYFVKMQTANQDQTQKAILMK